MATYDQIIAMRSDPGYTAFVDRVAVAIVVKAKAVSDEPSPTPTKVAWAKEALASPRATSNTIVHFVVAANITASTAAILGATDVLIQTNVDAAVDTLFGV